MKKNIWFNYLVFFATLCQSCSSTNIKEEKSRISYFSGVAMTMNYKIIVGEGLAIDKKDQIQNIIDKTFDEIDRIYNKWNPQSELSKLNGLKKGVEVAISTELSSFLEETAKLVFLSNGLFDPTIEPVQKLWKEALALGNTPTDKEIEDKMQVVGWDKIHFENGLFFKDCDETSLDLGGVAKGFAVDLLGQRLENAGYPDIFVEWGGEIKAMGTHPDRRPWHIFISRFENIDPNNAIAHLNLNAEAIATSGDYLQNWTVKKEDVSLTYFHLVHPKSGKLLTIEKHSIASASVVAKSCFLADALATTLMLFSKAQEAEKWILDVQKQYEGIKFWIVTRE